MNAVQALIGFAAWTLLLVIVVVLYRGVRIAGGTPINHWPRGEIAEDDIPFARRAADAHANCVENLPVFAVIVLAAAALNKLDAINGLAPWVLYLRIPQSLVHLSGTGQAQVFVRAGFWTAQVVLFVTMLMRIWG